MTKPKVVSFSGGQTSGYMLRRLIDKFGADKLTTLFCNTGKEYDETLDFVHAVETNWKIPIVWLEYCRENNEHSFKIVNYETAARRFDKQTPFDELLEWANSLPNVRSRRCSAELKVRTIKRYLKSLGLKAWNSYIGIRADEADRTLEILSQCPNYITAHFPLVDDGITRFDVNAWWIVQPFRLNIPNHMGNCDLCFLKAKWKRLAIMRDDPEAAKWWINWERKKESEMKAAGLFTTGARWIDGVSYEGLLNDAQHPEFDFSEQDSPCSCAVGGFREDDL